MKYPQRNAFEMKAHDAQFEAPESIMSIKADIDVQLAELKALING